MLWNNVAAYIIYRKLKTIGQYTYFRQHDVRFNSDIAEFMNSQLWKFPKDFRKLVISKSVTVKCWHISYLLRTKNSRSIDLLCSKLDTVKLWSISIIAKFSSTQIRKFKKNSIILQFKQILGQCRRIFYL